MSESAEQGSDKSSDKNNSKDYRYLVFIGRFQPFHCGHKAVVDEALKRADNVIMLIGSANLPRSLRNPFSVDERAAMIKNAYSPAEAARIHCVGLDDALYNDTRWLQYVQTGVKSVT
ncbi:MAG: adenylyltransferase/cytidyltransferase family protein, partial [Psychrobacter faecalis]